MGKGEIISGGTDGQYQVQIKYNRDRFNEIIEALNTKKGALQEDRVPIQAEKDGKQNELDTALSELNILIEEFISLSDDLSALQSVLAGLLNEQEHLKERLRNISDPTEIDDIRTFKEVQISLKQDQVDAQEIEISEAQDQLVVLNQELIDLENDIPQDPEAIAAKEAEISAKENQINSLQNELSDLQDELDVLIFNLEEFNLDVENPNAADEIQAELTIVENEIAVKRTEQSELTKEITANQKEQEEKQKEANTLKFETDVLIQKLSEIDLQITAIDKRIEYLTENMPADETIGAWCADLTEDLSGIVGTVEVPGELGEKGILQIQPGFEDGALYDQDRDGQLFPSIAMTPAQFYYNLAMLPGWQKWNPIFRYGTITSITDDAANVTLDSEMVSSAQDLNINQTPNLTNVDIDYMDCNGSAFKIDDEVLVMFSDQDFSNPKIIGFKTDPQSCDFYPAFEVSLGTSFNSDIVGIVVCKGGGFNPPYEFIEIPDYATNSDPFKYGQWVLNYGEMPFVLAEYLAPKEIEGRTEGDEIKKIYEIGAAGTQNAVYFGGLLPTSSSVGKGHSGVLFRGTDPDYAWAEASRSGSHSLDQGYFVPTAGKNNPDFFTTRFPNYFYQHDFEPTLDVDEITDGLVLAGYDSSGTDHVDVIHVDVILNPSSPGYDEMVIERLGLMEIWEFASFPEGIETDNFPDNQGRYVATTEGKASADHYEFYSSAIDDQHYFFLEDFFEYSVVTDSRHRWLGDEPSESTASYSDKTYILNCNGHKATITENMQSITSIALRYYQINGIEHFLCAIKFFVDGIQTRKYYHYTIENDIFSGYDPVEMTAISNVVEGVTDYSGNPLYNNKLSFKMVRI